jgi:di/tricarboxylate transporter
MSNTATTTLLMPLLFAAAAAAGGKGELQFYTPELPIFAVGCTVARFEID